jgi:hypothetical protein
VNLSDLQWLIDRARDGGAEGAWLKCMAGELVSQALELRELRYCVDPRKRQTLELARLVSKQNQALLAAGTPDRVTALCVRHGISRPTFYRFLKLSQDTQDTSVLESAP